MKPRSLSQPRMPFVPGPQKQRAHHASCGISPGVGSAYYKGECGYQLSWTWSQKRALRIEVDGSATSYLYPGPGSHLHLENMNLTELPAGVFDGLEYLHKLDLQGNKLRTLPQGLFRHLSSLRYLYLQNNGLEELPSSVLAKPCWFDMFVFIGSGWLPFLCSWIDNVFG